MIRNSTNRSFLIISDGCAFQQFVDEDIEDDQNEDIIDETISFSSDCETDYSCNNEKNNKYLKFRQQNVWTQSGCSFQPKNICASQYSGPLQLPMEFHHRKALFRPVNSFKLFFESLLQIIQEKIPQKFGINIEELFLYEGIKIAMRLAPKTSMSDHWK
jgi:hypothetical protein